MKVSYLSDNILFKNYDKSVWRITKKMLNQIFF